MFTAGPQIGKAAFLRCHPPRIGPPRKSVSVTRAGAPDVSGRLWHGQVRNDQSSRRRTRPGTRVIGEHHDAGSWWRGKRLPIAQAAASSE
ncbi:MAG: hypothetical protein D6725_07590 [Planctomycetota bacterium]|nr:MAG: hypothetical protein D6725_07590 [Planctomycetota bacterium]